VWFYRLLTPKERGQNTTEREREKEERTEKEDPNWCF